MRARDLAYETLAALDANRGRSILTVLGIVIGIAAVIAMTALIGGVRQSMIDQYGLSQARMVSMWCYYDREMNAEDVDALAKEMGAEFMLTSPANGGYLATYQELWPRLETTIRELGDYAAKLEVKLTVEPLTPYESNFFTRANDLAELFRRIDNPYLVGMCDVVPPFVQHESIMAYFDKLGPKMDHMHIIDGEQGTDSHILPGEGDRLYQ